MSIPKKIHFLWMSKEKDEKTLQCLASWEKHLEGYEIYEWNSDSFPYKDFIWTKEATEVKKWAFVTDYFRLWVLYNYGGIYMDADVMLQNNFDALLDCKFFAGTEFTIQIGCHCMGSVAGHPYIKKCLDFYKNRHFKNIMENGQLQEYAMPRIMTYILAKEYGVKTICNFGNEPIIIQDGIHIHPDSLLTIDVGNNQNVAVHLGLGSWRDASTFGNPVYMENLEYYFFKRFYLNDYKNWFSSKFKKWMFLFTPGFILSTYLKYRLKIKNSKTIMKVGSFINK